MCLYSYAPCVIIRQHFVKVLTEVVHVIGKVDKFTLQTKDALLDTSIKWSLLHDSKSSFVPSPFSLHSSPMYRVDPEGSVLFLEMFKMILVKFTTIHMYL